MSPEEAKNNYPNVWRVAQELARYERPERILNALRVLLEDDPSLLDGGTQDGNP